MTEEEETELPEPVSSDDDIEIRYQGLIDVYKDGRFTGDVGELRKLTVECFRLFNRVRSDPSQFSADDFILIIEGGYVAMRWLNMLLHKCDVELKRAD